MSRVHTVPAMPAKRTGKVLDPTLAVLIEVPAVRGARLTHFRPSSALYRSRRVQKTNRSGRRLRREVRLASAFLLALTPLVSVCTIGWSNRPARILACAISDSADSPTGHDGPADSADSKGAVELQRGTAIGAPGGILLSIEPLDAAPASSTKIPVIFPGYVLPADSLEDRAHAGN